MKKSLKPNISSVDQIVINALSKHPQILDKIIKTKTIWFPEWKHFSIVSANGVYLLFEGQAIVYYNTAYETVWNNLVERFHFSDLAALPVTKRHSVKKQTHAK